MDTSSIAFLALVTFSILATFFLTLKHTGKIKYAILAVLFLVKFIAIFGYLYGVDRPLFTIALVHRRYNVKILEIHFTVNLMVFLSTLTFTLYVILGSKLYRILPHSIRDYLIPKWVRE